MAINFGDTIIDGGIAPSVRVQSPVQDDSGAILAQGFEQAAKVAGSVFGSMVKGQQEDASAKILTAYENDLLDIADFVDQGGDRNEAMIRARTLRRQYLSNAPALQDDFDTVWTDFAGANGLGNVVISGTLEQQANDAKRTEAIKLGYNSVQEYDTFLARARQATALNQEVEMLTAQGSIVTQTQKNAATRAVVGLADSAFPAAQTQINNAMAQITANPSQKAAITAQLNTTLGQNIAQLQAITGGADNAYIITPIQGLLDTFNKWSNNEIENSVMEGALKNTQLQYTTMYNNDPVLGPIIAQSKLLNDLGLANSNLGVGIWSPEALKKLREVSDPKSTVNLLTNDEGAARFTQNIQEIAGQIKPDSDPALVEEVMQSINSAVDGVYVHERGTTDGAIGFKDTVEMLGSPQVGEVIRQNGGVDAKYGDQFVSILQENYESELLPAITRYWESVPVGNPQADTSGTNNAAGISNTPMSQLLTPVWNGSAVEFVPKDQYASNPRVVALAAEVNSGNNSIGKPLNSLINAYANVGGIDAKTVWEQDFAGRLFNMPGGQEAEAPVADRVTQMLDSQQTDTAVQPMSFTTEEDLINNPTAQNLTMADFQPDQLEAVVHETSAAQPEQVLNASNPIQFAEAFIGKTDTNAEDVAVLSQFIQNTAGISINPAQTAWCAAFVDAILRASGQGPGTGKLNARSYLNWGKPVLDKPQVGDVVVLSRGDPDGWQGHVGFYAGMNADGTIRLLGGNQSDAVGFSDYDVSRVLGYRRAN